MKISKPTRGDSAWPNEGSGYWARLSLAGTIYLLLMASGGVLVLGHGNPSWTVFAGSELTYGAIGLVIVGVLRLSKIAWSVATLSVCCVFMRAMGVLPSVRLIEPQMVARLLLEQGFLSCLSALVAFLCATYYFRLKK